MIPDYYSEGTYTVQTTYVVHPPIEDDGTTAHLNLKFAGSNHIPYQYIRITVPADGIEQIYVYPPTLTAEKTGDTYTITGSAAENENIAIEMLAGENGFGQMPGFRSKASDLQSKTASANFWYNLPYTAATSLITWQKRTCFLCRSILLLIYYHYGRERKFTVTTYLSTIPNLALKPWQVNLLFKDDALDFDQDGYYATLLDLHRRKLISITRRVKAKGKGLRSVFSPRRQPIPMSSESLHLSSDSQKTACSIPIPLKLWSDMRRSTNCRGKSVAVPEEFLRCDDPGRYLNFLRIHG